MDLECFDYRRDVRNIFITPAVRARFQRIEAGTVTPPHTHDVGYELWVVMSGQVEFTIAGRSATLGPGQACVARPDEPHWLRVVGDEAATVFLTVTPHLEPTHTWWHEDGTRAEPRWGGATVNERARTPEVREATLELIERYRPALAALSAAVSHGEDVQSQALDALQGAVVVGDVQGVGSALKAIGEEMGRVHNQLLALTAVWNELAPRAAGK